MEILQRQFRVPEIYGDFWFNSEPIPLAALRGYTILIDFWDYACQKCLQTLPYLQEWYRRYADKGLVIIGVHAPRFPFESDPINVRTAIEKLDIRYPVVVDNSFIIWTAFQSMEWPTKFLIDKNGFVRYVQPGTGSYQEMEHAIQSMLSESGFRDDLPLVMEPLRDIDRPGALCYRETPEILTGWQRGTIGNVEGYSPESTLHYEDPRYYLNGRLYLHGNWLNNRDYLKLNEEGGGEGHIVILYEAKEVNAVIKPEGENSFQVFIQQDDAWLAPGLCGSDVRVDEEGKSYLLVGQAKLYNLVRNAAFGEHKLKLMTRSTGFALYSVSFVSCVMPEMVSNN